MRTLQLAKTILFLLLVLALNVSSAVFALDANNIPVSGGDTNEPLTLEEDSAVLPSSPDSETASVLSLPLVASSDRPLFSNDGISLVAIYAVNPGYNLSSGKNSGELIELINLSDEELDLSGLSIVYIAKPTSTYPDGKATIIYTFPDGATFVGDRILLRYAGSPEAINGAQDLTYDAASLAMTGSLKLIFPTDVASSTSPTSSDAMTADELLSAGTVLSSVCWLGGESCLPVFSTTVKSRQYTTILLDTETGEYFHTTEYIPTYDVDHPGLYFSTVAEPFDDESDYGSFDELAENPSSPSSSSSSSGPNQNLSSISGSSQKQEPVCSGLEFSEILTYYTDDKSEQFIEFYNASDVAIPLEKCRLRFKNKSYPLLVESTANTDGSTASASTALAPGAYYVYYPTVALTKNPTTSNLYELLDANDDVIDSLNLPHGQKKSASFALTGKVADGSNLWQITYALTPGGPNSYQEFRSCPAGKVINITTGNCVNVATLDATIKDCPAGKYRNPATGRCKSYDTDDSDELTPCQEGYERNPETNRCRRIKQNNGAEYPLVPITDTPDNTSFVAIWALVGVLALGFLYVIFQFRRDILYAIRRLLNKIKR